MGLEGINTVSLIKPVSVPRLTIWAVWPKISYKGRKKIKLGPENFARAGLQGTLPGKGRAAKGNLGRTGLK